MISRRGVSILFHDRLPSLRLWRPRALTRDWVAPTTVLSAARHYNLTMASRSFHIVSEKLIFAPS